MRLHLQSSNFVPDAAALAVVEWKVAHSIGWHDGRAWISAEPAFRVELERVKAPDFGIALKNEHGNLQVGSGGDEEGLQAITAWEVIIFDRNTKVQLQARESKCQLIEQKLSKQEKNGISDFDLMISLYTYWDWGPDAKTFTNDCIEIWQRVQLVVRGRSVRVFV